MPLESEFPAFMTMGRNLQRQATTIVQVVKLLFGFGLPNGSIGQEHTHLQAIPDNRR